MSVTSEATTSWTGSLTEGSGRIALESSNQGPFEVNWKARSEGSQAVTTPEELIAAAHSSCFSMALSHALAGNGTPPESVETSAAVTFIPGTGITGSHLNVHAVVPGREDVGRGAGELGLVEAGAGAATRAAAERRAEHRGPARHADPALAGGGLVDHAQHRAAAVQQRDQAAEQRAPGDEGAGAVDRVDHPHMLGLGALGAVLLADHAVVGRGVQPHGDGVRRRGGGSARGGHPATLDRSRGYRQVTCDRNDRRAPGSRRSGRRHTLAAVSLVTFLHP